MKYGIKKIPGEWGARDVGMKKVNSRVSLLGKYKDLDPGHGWRYKEKAENMVMV